MLTLNTLRRRLLLADSCALLGILTACGGTADVNDVAAPPPPPPAAPVIVTPPLAQSVTAGASATFTVSATGDALSYQWQRGDAAINAATAASYTTPATTLADNGSSFRVRVCSGPQATGTCVTSAAATLTVTAPVGIGPAGGTVDGPNGARAVVPAGALTTFVDIRVATASGAGVPAFPPAGLNAVGAVYAFTPHGTAFAQPATVRVPFDPALLPAGATPRLFRAEPGGSFAEVSGATVTGNFLEAQVNGFSFFGPGAAPPPAGALRFSEIARSCAREALSGNVYCWGDMGDTAFGSGLTVSANSPVFPEPTRLPVRSLTNVVKGGFGFVCGLNVAEVWCIGDDRITAASGVDSPNPRQWVRIQLPTGVVLDRLSAGGAFMCGIGAPNSPDQDAPGRVFCWGNNTRGQLGRGPGVFPGQVVAPVLGNERFVAVAA